MALTGALAAALVAGVLDHYFFHIGFAHMVALFWGLAALAVVAARLTGEVAGRRSQVAGLVVPVQGEGSPATVQR